MPISEEFAEAGYDGRNAIMNLGSTNVYLAVMVSGFTVHWAFKLIEMKAPCISKM